MAFNVLALASGSSGNATLVYDGDAGKAGGLLIDAGISVRKLVAGLAAVEIPPEQLKGVVLTHEHGDHASSAAAFARKFSVPVIANRATLSRVLRSADAPYIELPTGDRFCAGDFTVETFPAPHDAVEPVGVNVYAAGAKACLVTDLGSITPAVRRASRGADLLICETNHDVYRLKAGPYPDELKRRILSEKGHLSNDAAAAFMIEHLHDKGPCTFWLAHLSKVNNTPRLASNFARATLKLHAQCPFALDVAMRDRPSASWRPGRTCLQLSLF